MLCLEGDIIYEVFAVTFLLESPIHISDLVMIIIFKVSRTSSPLLCYSQDGLI